MRHPYIPEPGENGRYQPSYGMDGDTQSQPAVEYTEPTVDFETNQHATCKSNWWIYATVILCCYGFFKEFKPSEPFLTPYLEDNSTNSSKNFTKAQVNGEIYPFWPYSYLVSLLFVFLFTDVLRYKPVILVEAGAYFTTRILLIWGTSVSDMQWMQVGYGVATAAEIAYYSYIYVAVSVVHFKKVTSYIRAVRLFGQAMAGIIAQVLISTKTSTYLQLNYISLASVSVACIFALLLPKVCTLCTCPCCKEVTQVRTETRSPRKSIIGWIWDTIKKRWYDFKKFYSNLSLLKWSIWWALATCGVLQVGNYVQSLWKEVATEGEVEYNGLVEALATLCSAGAAFVLSFMKVNWPVWGEVTIGLLSLVDGVVLLVASAATTLWLAYLCHILYRTTYAFLITIASAQLAYNVDYDSYALIFGFNTFIALLLQTLLTLAVSDKHGLNLHIRTQFVVYSGYYYVLTLIFIGAGVYKLTSTGWLKSLHICCHEFIPHARGGQSLIQNEDSSESEESVSQAI